MRPRPMQRFLIGWVWLALLVIPAGCGRPSATSQAEPSASETRNKPDPGGTSRALGSVNGKQYLQSIDGTHSWAFDFQGFVLTAENGKEIPAQLRKALLGSERSATRIVGEWDLTEGEVRLVLTAISAGGEPGVKEARLEVSPAGPARVNIDQWQYNRFTKRP